MYATINNAMALNNQFTIIRIVLPYLPRKKRKPPDDTRGGSNSHSPTSLAVHFQVDGRLWARVERAQGLGVALGAFMRGIHFVVHIRRERSEAVVALVVRREA